MATAERNLAPSMPGIRSTADDATLAVGAMRPLFHFFGFRLKKGKGALLDQSEGFAAGLRTPKGQTGSAEDLRKLASRI